MKTIPFFLLCFLSMKTIVAQKSGVPYQRIKYIFYTEERSDSSIDLLFEGVGLLFEAVNRSDAFLDSNIEKQVTIKTVVAFNINGESIQYEKTYTISKGTYEGSEGIILTENYPTEVGALYRYPDRLVLAQALNQFVRTTANAYRVIRKKSKLVKI